MKKIQKDTIAHYQRMIAFAEAQDRNSKPDFELMVANIGEYWFGSCCPYCKRYMSICDECILGAINFICCGGYWLFLNDSATWKEWIICANKIIEYVKAHG